MNVVAMVVVAAVGAACIVAVVVAEIRYEADKSTLRAAMQRRAANRRLAPQEQKVSTPNG